MIATAPISPPKVAKSKATLPPRRSGLIGPAVLVAAAGIGASDIIAASVVGARFGLALLWAIVLGAALKAVLSEGIAHWQFTSQTTLLQGISSYLPRWVLVVFTGYLLVWTVGVAAALGNGAGLAVENLTGGYVPRAWGAVAHVLLGTAIVSFGRFSTFTRTMKVLIITMFIAIVICAVRFAPSTTELLRGFVPSVPAASGPLVLSLVGGIGGSVTLLTYNYFPPQTVVHSRGLRAMRLDIILAYTFTAFFGISMLLIASRTFHGSGLLPTGSDIIEKTAHTLGTVIGPAGFYIYSVGFFAAVLASLIGTWQTIPLLIAECYALLRRFPSDRHARTVSSHSDIFRWALGLITISGIAFAFVGRPLALIVGYTILASFVVPFIAAVLLFLNSKAHDSHSTASCHGYLMRAILLSMLVLFLLTALQELFRLLRT